MEQIQKDFDRIAVLSEHESEHGGAYDPFLLRFIPPACDRALEIGCGTGAFTRLLARRAKRVTATDLSGEMIRVARRLSTGYRNIDYSVGDVLEMNLPVGHFDCIVMIATLHHLPTGSVLEKLKQALTPGGALIVHDLLTPAGVFDRAADLVRLPASMARRCLKTGRLWARRDVRRAWAEHGKGERYLTRQGVEAMRDQYLQGGYVRFHLLWRYTLVWRKQDDV
ncbi:MAG TPA: class I SAM-dependent methyltransferase [Blastocatellia bacterium]|nr:class I SAM-dependent methyltransferase [Blastocatellia bacterium]